MTSIMSCRTIFGWARMYEHIAGYAYFPLAERCTGKTITAGFGRLSIVPTLQHGNAAGTAPAVRDAGASTSGFPRRSVGTIMNGLQLLAIELEPDGACCPVRNVWHWLRLPSTDIEETLGTGLQTPSRLELSETLQTLITTQQLAQSIKEQMLIISADQAFTGYPVSLIW
jgi:hypothetical protein